MGKRKRKASFHQESFKIVPYVLRVRLVPNVWLECGTHRLENGVVIIEPPKTSLFDQVVRWLESVPPPVSQVLNEADGVMALTTLCVRWGSWLAWLMDEDKLPAPGVDDEETSQLSQAEMARINIEISSNVEQLLLMKFNEPTRFDDLIWQAAAYLPHPPLTPEPALLELNLVQAILETTHLVQMPTAHVALEAGLRPERAIANLLVHAFYRNGPIEDSHAGARYVPDVNLGRFSSKGRDELLYHTAERLGWALNLDLAWKGVPLKKASPAVRKAIRAEKGSIKLEDGPVSMSEFGRKICTSPSYPREWSLTESCREMRIPIRE